MDPDKASQQIGWTQVKGHYDLLRSLRLFQLASPFLHALTVMMKVMIVVNSLAHITNLCTNSLNLNNLILTTVLSI